jgi:hypothetical protein
VLVLVLMRPQLLLLLLLLMRAQHCCQSPAPHRQRVLLLPAPAQTR